MPTDLYLAEELRKYLVAQSVVQNGESASGDTPPACWWDLRDGAPEPELGAADAAAIVTLITGPEIPGQMHEGSIIKRVVECRVRAKTRPRAELIQRQIRGQLEEKKNFTAGSLHIQIVKMWRGTQPIASSDTSHTLTQSFWVDAFASAYTV